MPRSALGVLVAVSCAGCFSPPPIVSDDDERGQTSGFAEPSSPAQGPNGEDWDRASESGDPGDESGEGPDEDDDRDDDDDDDDEGESGGEDDGDEASDGGQGSGGPDDDDDDDASATDGGEIEAGTGTGGTLDDPTGGEASGGETGVAEEREPGGTSGGPDPESTVYRAACLLLSAAADCDPSCRGWETTSLDEYEALTEQCYADTGVLITNRACPSAALGTCTFEEPEVTVHITYDAEAYFCLAEDLPGQCESDGGDWTPA